MCVCVGGCMCVCVWGGGGGRDTKERLYTITCTLPSSSQKFSSASS